MDAVATQPQARLRIPENVRILVHQPTELAKKYFETNGFWPEQIDAAFYEVEKQFQYNEAAVKLFKETKKWPEQTAEWGELKDELNYSNLVPTAGKAGVTARLGGVGSPAAYTYMAIGTGTNAAAAGDTTLQTEITTGGGSRANSTVTQVTTTTTNDTLQIDHQFTFTSSFAVTELGILNAASSGTLLSRIVFSAINVVNGTIVQFYWKMDVT